MVQGYTWHIYYLSDRWDLGQYKHKWPTFLSQTCKNIWLQLTHKPHSFLQMKSCQPVPLEGVTTGLKIWNLPETCIIIQRHFFCIPHLVKVAWDPGSTRVTAGWHIQTNMKHLTDSQPVQTSSSRHNARKRNKVRQHNRVWFGKDDTISASCYWTSLPQLTLTNLSCLTILRGTVSNRCTPHFICQLHTLCWAKPLLTRDY